MALDRGELTRIDRRLLAGLGEDETWQMVRVPTTPAMWPTWKRYCDAAGISMGRAIAGLIAHDLSSVLGVVGGEGSPVFSARVDEELAKRKEEVARREQELETAEDRLRVWDRQLRRRQGNLEARERQAELAARVVRRPEQSRGMVGRNKPCPCGSGRKYKRCHGSPANKRRRASGTDGPRG